MHGARRTVLVAGYIFSCAAWLLRIAFGRLWKKRPPTRAHLSLSYVLTEDCRDCDYHLLWETQQPALKFLRSAGSRGATVARMTQFYREFAHVYPELCDGSDFVDWLAALKESEVVIREGSTVTITEKARFILALLSGETRALTSKLPGTMSGQNEMKLTG